MKFARLLVRTTKSYEYVENECVKNRLAVQKHICMRSFSLATILLLFLSPSPSSSYILYRRIFSCIEN